MGRESRLGFAGKIVQPDIGNTGLPIEPFNGNASAVGFQSEAKSAAFLSFKNYTPAALKPLTFRHGGEPRSSTSVDRYSDLQ
jgi:hypothetical protein